MSHALLSPSGASRWLVCTPSARLETEFPDRPTEAAAEGTLAHKLGENMIHRQLGYISLFTYEMELKEIEQNKLYTPAMKSLCNDYASYVIEVYHTVLAKDPAAQIFIEQKIDLKSFVPEGFGTGDACIVGAGELHFIDLKFGKGVLVEAEENAQTKLYSLGLLQRFEFEYGINDVHMHIFQPRKDNISKWSTTTVDLWNWADDFLKPRAEQAFKGDGDFNPGEKQCFFCRAKPRCRAYADYNMEIAKLAFKNIHLLSDEEMADILKKAKSLGKWLTAVQEYALNEAYRNKKQWPGFKLVEGRSNRVYSSQEEVINALRKAGHLDTSILQPAKLKGFDDLKAFIGGVAFSKIVEPKLVKPKGAPTLVPLSDKRPVFSHSISAEEAFSGIDMEAD